MRRASLTTGTEREGGRERERGRERGREGEMDGGREGGRQRGREGGREREMPGLFLHLFAARQCIVSEITFLGSVQGLACRHPVTAFGFPVS